MEVGFGSIPFSGSFYHLYQHRHNNLHDESGPLPEIMQQNLSTLYVL